MKASTIRACGAMIMLGGFAWAYGWLQAGVMPEGVNDQIEIWTSGVFQLGLVALLATMRATDATGTTRPARFVLNAEIVAVALAIAWTVPFLFDANRPHTGILVVLDAFWPLSMMGLIAVGVFVVRARVWPHAARYLPLVASLLLPLDILLMAVGAGEWSQIVVRSVYLSMTYGLLGIAVMRHIAASAETAGDTQPTVGRGAASG
ncbi:MAG: hypothetical protein H0V05_04710 [Euzebyaceae bacterium]|nr:hypothetical protein [Euzebyaceae bacterium]